MRCPFPSALNSAASVSHFQQKSQSLLNRFAQTTPRTSRSNPDCPTPRLRLQSLQNCTGLFEGRRSTKPRTALSGLLSLRFGAAKGLLSMLARRIHQPASVVFERPWGKKDLGSHTRAQGPCQQEAADFILSPLKTVKARNQGLLTTARLGGTRRRDRRRSPEEAPLEEERGVAQRGWAQPSAGRRQNAETKGCDTRGLAPLRRSAASAAAARRESPAAPSTA